MRRPDAQTRPCHSVRPETAQMPCCESHANRRTGKVAKRGMLLVIGDWSGHLSIGGARLPKDLKVLSELPTLRRQKSLSGLFARRVGHSDRPRLGAIDGLTMPSGGRIPETPPS